MKTNEVVQRIKNCYVSDECVQIMIPYRKNAIIFNKDGIVYSHNTESINSINSYLTDERRYEFPYFNIPTHRGKKGLFKFNYTNQLLNFEEPYISLVDGKFIERYAVKDGNEALMIKKIMFGNEKIEYMTRSEVEEIFEKSFDENEKMYILDSNGVIASDDCNFVVNEERILRYIKKKYHSNLQAIINYGKSDSTSTIGLNAQKYPDFLEFVSQSIDNMTIGQLKAPVTCSNFSGEDTSIIVKINGNDIKIQTVEIIFISSNRYKVCTVDIPVTKYTLEQLKYLTPKIIPTKELNIPLKFNPGVTKEDIQRAKKLVKESVK